jgi:membrane protein DedA with SNARE-associated domain
VGERISVSPSFTVPSVSESRLAGRDGDDAWVPRVPDRGGGLGRVGETHPGDSARSTRLLPTVDETFGTFRGLRRRWSRCATLMGVGEHEITQLLHEYGCLLVFVIVALQAVGAPLPGTTVLIAAAVYAGTAHGLPIAGVIAAGALGALAGTSAGFALGRWGGERLLLRVGARLRQSPERVAQLRNEFAAHGAAFLFIGRFITGVRNVIGLVAGASGMALSRFLPVTAAAATVWALVNALEYYWFGHALAGASTWVQILLVCAGLVWMIVSLRVLRCRALRRIERAGSPAEAG